MAQVLKIPALSSVRISTEQILSCNYTEPLKGIFLASKTIEVICDIVNHLNSADTSRFGWLSKENKSHAIDAAAAIYRREIRKPPTIDQLALRVGINRNVLTAGFLEKFGVTPHAFSVKLRMEEAQALLEGCEISVSEVARRVGYSGYASFARAYGEHFGRSIRDRKIKSDSGALTFGG
jgi:transcriptional regulator GlxA family with amidase domain